MLKLKEPRLRATVLKLMVPHTWPQSPLPHGALRLADVIPHKKGVFRGWLPRPVSLPGLNHLLQHMSEMVWVFLCPQHKKFFFSHFI